MQYFLICATFFNKIPLFFEVSKKKSIDEKVLIKKMVVFLLFCARLRIFALWKG